VAVAWALAETQAAAVAVHSRLLLSSSPASALLLLLFLPILVDRVAAAIF
jgi:hypothetical protein